MCTIPGVRVADRLVLPHPRVSAGFRRRRRIPGQLPLFALGTSSLAAAAVIWVTHQGPRIAAEQGFIGAVPFTMAGIVLLTSALLRPGREHEMRRVAQLELLQRAAHRMSSALSVGAVGRAIVEETRGLIDYHNARVYVLEPPNTLLPVAFEGRVGAYERVDLELLRTQVGQGFTGWAALHATPVRVDNARSDPRGATIPGTDDVDESMLVVPLIHDATVVGVITLSKLGQRQFDDDDLRLLTILGDQAAIAMASVRALGETRRLASELRRLLDMSSDLSGSLETREVANRIAQHIGKAMDVDETEISYWDREGDRLLTLGYHPEGTAFASEVAYSLAGFPATRAVLRDQRILTVDIDDVNADPAEVTLLREQGMRSLVMLPLVAKGQSVGIVELLSRGSGVRDEHRLELAQTMANEAAMALENARLYEDARRLADRDPLTGFYNHRYLHERLAEEVVRAQRTRQPLSVLMLDLDEFKLVNDTLGHLFGDRVLVHVAEQIRSAIRASDVPARYGGDEFAVILPETDAAAARVVAERVDSALRSTPYQADGRLPVAVTASVGLATYPRDGRTSTELIATADRGLYSVKAVASRPAPGRRRAVRGSRGGSEAA